ncbi:MAG: hypothetical protein QM820_43515 [Minicystis sp.]
MALAATLLQACDPQRIDALEEGVATEADVRKQFGEPEKMFGTRRAVAAPSSTAASRPATATT